MFRKFLSGIVFGAGFGIAFILVVTIYFSFFFGRTALPDRVIDSPPKIAHKEGYLGSTGYYDGDFLNKKNDVLASGPGQIVGNVLINDSPLPGLKLRLALNGGAMSQWATSDDEGKYTIDVPLGQYKIDGFEIDFASANSVLAGKIEHPNLDFRSEIFSVDENEKGRGLTLVFVDPVIKNISKLKYSVDENVVVSWLSHPAASQYRLQIIEKQSPRSHNETRIFDWPDRPVTDGTSFDLKKHGIKLKAGHFYNIEIEALDNESTIVSQTSRKNAGYDFEIIE